MFSQTNRTYALLFSKDKVRVTLEGYGLRADRFPPSLGGTWDYSIFYDSLRIQVQNSKSSSSSTTTSSHQVQQPSECSSPESSSVQSRISTKKSSVTSFSPSRRHTETPSYSTTTSVSDVSLDGSNYSDRRQRNVPSPLSSVPTGSSIKKPTKKDNRGSIDLTDDIVIDAALNVNILVYNNYDSTKVADQISSHIAMRRLLFGNRAKLQINQTTGKWY
jgi:hypothetical protein